MLGAWVRGRSSPMSACTSSLSCSAGAHSGGAALTCLYWRETLRPYQSELCVCVCVWERLGSMAVTLVPPNWPPLQTWAHLYQEQLLEAFCPGLMWDPCWALARGGTGGPDPAWAGVLTVGKGQEPRGGEASPGDRSTLARWLEGLFWTYSGPEPSDPVVTP